MLHCVGVHYFHVVPPHMVEVYVFANKFYIAQFYLYHHWKTLVSFLIFTIVLYLIFYFAGLMQIRSSIQYDVWWFSIYYILGMGYCLTCLSVPGSSTLSLRYGVVTTSHCSWCLPSLIVMRTCMLMCLSTLSWVLLALGKFGDFSFLNISVFILVILHWCSLIVQSLTVSDCFIKEYWYNIYY